MRSRRPPLPIILLAHALVYAAALTMLLPFAWMVLTSLKSPEDAMDLSRGIIPRVWHWENFSEAIRAARLDRFFLNSFVVGAITTVLGVFHCASAGYALAKLRFTGRKVVLWILLATMMLPMQVSFIMAYLIAAGFGLTDSLPALIVPFLASGFGIFFMRQAISAVPDAILEAARIDGMSELDIFWCVVRPGVTPAIAALAIITFVNSWNSFFWPLVVCDREEVKTLPLAVAELASGQFVQSWPVRMAAVTIITLPLVVVFLFFQRAFVAGLASSGLKE